MTDPTSNLVGLGMALALGTLIGLERGWHEREADEGDRVAGIRTFVLVALLGGLCASLPSAVAPFMLPAGFLALAALLGLGHFLATRQDADLGMTTVIAALSTFVLGALSASGHYEIALATAVVISLVLGLKPQIHAAIAKLSTRELLAVLKLLLISVVALPLMPDRGYGPWQALNPYEIWWMVVLIAVLSSAGYFAMRLTGPRRGLLLTGVFGGLVSSTALTLSFAQMCRRDRALTAPLAGGILLACAMMFPRMWVEVVLVRPGLAPRLLPAVLVTVTIIAGVFLWQRPWRTLYNVPRHNSVSNPFELRSALFFGLLLGAAMLLTHAGQAWLGDDGIYLVTVVAALADVDAITLALARAADNGLDMSIAGQGILLSATVNTLVKGLMAAAIGGRALFMRVTLPLLGASTTGLAVVFLF